MEHDLFQLHADLEEAHWWFLGRRDIMRRIVRWALPPGGSLIVDVGCGTGANIGSLSPDYKCVGVDPSAEGIRLAAERFPGVSFVRGQAPEDIQAHVEGADLFLMMDVLEHVPDDFRLLSSILALAKPGAQVLITVPAHPYLWSEHDLRLHHYRRYELPRLRRLWRGLPVTERLASYFNARLYPVARIARAVSRLRGRALGRGGTDLAMPPGPVNAVLRRTFAGESGVLLRLAEGQRRRGFRTGLSLIALIQRGPGRIAPFDRPSDVPADEHFPHLAAGSSPTPYPPGPPPA